MKKLIIFLFLDILCMSGWSENKISNRAQCDTLYQKACQSENEGKYEKALIVFIQVNNYFTSQQSEDNELNANSLHRIGRCYLSLDKMDGLVFTEKAAEIRKKLFGELNPDYLNSLNNIGMFYLADKQYDKAIEIQKRVLGLCAKMKKPHPKRAMFNLNLSREYLAIGEKTKAEAIYTYELSNVQKQNGAKSEEYADLLSTIGSSYYTVNDKKNCVKYFEQALNIFPLDSEKYENILNYISTIYIDLNDNDKIIKYQKLVQEHNQRELQKECIELKCMLERAEYYTVIGDIPNAKNYYIKAIAMCDNKLVTKIERYKVCSSYGKFLYDNKDYANSAENYILASNELKNDSNLMINYFNAVYKAGFSLYFAQEYSKSIDYLKISCDYLAKTDSSFLNDYINALIMIGDAYSFLEEYENSIHHYRKVIEIYQSQKQISDNLARAYSGVARVKYYKHDYYFALNDYMESAAIYKQTGNDVSYWGALSDIQRCYIMLGNKEKELEYKNLLSSSPDPKARILSAEKSNIESYKLLFGEDGLQYANSLNLISQILYDKGNYSESLDYSTKFLNSIRMSIRNNFRLLGESDRNRIWNDQIENMDRLMLNAYNSSTNDTAISDGFAKLAYDVQLISKGILLNSYIEFEDVLKQSGNDTLLKEYTTIKQNVGKIAQMQSSIQNNENTVSIEDINKLKIQNEKLQIDLMKKSTEFGDYTKYLSLIWTDIQSSLSVDDIAIEFAKLKTGLLNYEDTYVAILLRKSWNAPKIITLTTQEKIQALEADSSMYNKNTLGEIIWNPVSNFLDGVKNVYFSSDADLYQIGIEYLLYKDKPFNKQYKTYRLSSTKELAMNRAVIDCKEAILFGGLFYDAASEKNIAKKDLSNNKKRGGTINFEYLPKTKDEVDKIAKCLTKKNIKSKKHTGYEGNEKLFKSISATNVNILHLATHGDFLGDIITDENSAMDGSILALSSANDMTDANGEDGIVSASEIAKMDFRKCDLAVLSACRTGNGLVHNDGVFGLQRGFKNAGVRTMIMSLWKVDDKATSLLMSQFYNYLTSGYTKYESFVKSQEYLRNNGYADSKYWAAFIMLDGL